MSKSLPRKASEATADLAVDYASSVQLLTDWIDTTNFVAIAGRGTSKSTVIISRRIYNCVELMPGAPLAIVADTYTNLVNNIMPAVQNGWKLRGLIEGIHYIKGRRPPQEWSRRCSVIVDDYRYVYSFWNGTVLFLGSLDSPSLLAGKSVAHLFFDEAKYASDARAARVMPILRGNAVTYGSCHLYGGVTITTDMPDVAEGEYDWFFRYAAEMDPDRIVRIVQAASIRNDYLTKLTRASRGGKTDTPWIARLERKVQYYDRALAKLRRGQTFFANLSSFANIDILTLDYARRLYNGALEHHEFTKSVLGMRPGLRRSSRFYVMFTEDLKFRDGSIAGGRAYNGRQLRYLKPDEPIEGGMDFGNMMSLVLAQPDGRRFRVLKSMYVLAPHWLQELAEQFRAFFCDHRCKVLRLYYDRAANSYQRQKQDLAGKFKEFIERDEAGNRTGWAVELMSRGQATLRQEAEYNFQIELMSGTNKALPQLSVDADNCEELVSSLELARQVTKYKGSSKSVFKVKTSEKMALEKLPRLSTNMSDAFKYLVMRREWLNAVRPAGTNNSNADVAAAAWLERTRRNQQ